MAVNCATTIERNPVALEPSACIPLIPHTERIDTLKMYGEAPVTVSVSIVTVAEDTEGRAGRFDLTKVRLYVNLVGEIIDVTFVETL